MARGLMSAEPVTEEFAADPATAPAADPALQPAAEPARAAAPSGRLPALDWMRGLVMILMIVDHASGAMNAGRLITDGAFSYKPGTPLPADQFFTRWVTHLCAPTFVFLAGSALALSVEKQLAAGVAARKIDGFIARRGLLIAALDVLWMSWAFLRPGAVLLQVLYAIGMGLVCMIPLRRLPARWLFAAGLSLCVGAEALAGLALWLGGGGQPGLAAGLLVTGGRFSWGFIAYPLLPWLAIMMMGWSFGSWLYTRPQSPERVLAAAGAASLVVFGAVRGINAYGNMQLLREDGTIIQWLHVSKYPPGITYTALELGLFALLLAGFFVVQRRAEAPAWTAPLLVLGQTALFYYVLHVHLLKLAAYLLDLQKSGGLRETYIGALGALLFLYPLCVLYGRYKRAHPGGWTRYL